MDRSTVANLIRTSEIAGSEIVPIVRVRNSSDTEILKALDSGALGVQVPDVNSADEAFSVADASHYAPLGHRGLGTAQRAIAYGLMDKQEYFSAANEEVLTVVQCESVSSVNNLDRILEVEGVDVVFVGAMDLSQSMGAHIMGRRNNPELVALFNSTISKIVASGKVAGAAAGGSEDVKMLLEMGVRYITIGNEITFLKNSAKQALDQCKKIKGEII